MYTETHLQALREALAKGEKSVSYGDKTITYRDISELKVAITEVEYSLNRAAADAGSAPRYSRQIRCTTAKGF